MHAHPSESICGHHLNRRQFLLRTGALSAAGLASGSILATPEGAEAFPRENRDKMTPAEILERMERGNARFRAGERKDRSYLAEQKATVSGQFPAAVILSCIDSRAPAEVIMDLGIGDVFNARVAGNITNDDIVGSMEFACKVAGSKVILVMGHTSCGAVKGAVDDVHLGLLTGLLAKIRPAIEATSFQGERSGENPAFIDAVARTNVEMTMANIRKSSEVLRELEAQGTLKIAGAMYDLSTAKVDFYD